MSESRVDEIKELLKQHKKVYVNDLSARFNVSEVSIRKYLSRIESQGFADRFYGGASLVEAAVVDDGMDGVYTDPLWVSLAQQARKHISDGDSIFIGSGRSCCVLARELNGLQNLTVVTNNITALPELIKNATRVYLIGGEVTSTDNQTLFSSWESPQTQLENIFVNKAFTSISGLDLKAGLTVDSIITTYIYKQIPSMAHRWYLLVDSKKFDKISIHQVAELDQIHTLITDKIPQHYIERLAALKIEVIQQ